MPDAVKLMIGAGGIYGAFMYYGTLQEDIFSYKGVDGSKFKAVWLLQALGRKSYLLIICLQLYESINIVCALLVQLSVLLRSSAPYCSNSASPFFCSICT